jgi:1,4-dihydroxy-2-naphthoate octaprenyltransferase
MAVSAKVLLGVSRAPFLLLPVTLVAVGAAASAFEGGFDGLSTVLALIGMIGAHVGVNALNEASDMQTGIDLRTTRTPFSGGSGTLPSGAFSVRGTYVWALSITGAAALIGVWFLIRIGWPLLPIFLLGAFSVLAYTHLLARAGLGELFAGLGLGCLPILGVSMVQDGHLGAATVAASIPAFFMTFNLLLLNEFPDEEADRSGGRRNLVILLGRPPAAVIYVLATLAVPATLVVAFLLRALPAWTLIACLPTLLTVPGLRWALTRPETAVPLPALGGNVIWNLATNLLLALGLFLSVP